jgi:hypothetical protein
MCLTQPALSMIHEIDPLSDPRWSEFVDRHPSGSVFHTAPWLELLSATYAYKPAVLTTTGPHGDLLNGIVFCRVQSRLTGNRLVSLPFSDHCEPLVDNPDDLQRLSGGLAALAKLEKCRYVELRPLFPLKNTQPGFQGGASFYLHRLDLRLGAKEIFRRLHRDCIQRKVRRAQKEHLEVKGGRDAELLRDFYLMVVRTRRRQGLPPQPKAWFRNILHCMRDSAVILVAYKDAAPIGGILTLQRGKVLYYKYGASESEFHSMGAMPYLLWTAIESGIDRGLEQLDMGRSEPDNLGLVAFKERWGAERSELTYWRSPAAAVSPVSNGAWGRMARRVCGHIPDKCLAIIGGHSYRHVG